MNSAQFVGNLGRDFELQTHTKKSNGEAFVVAKNSVAITERRVFIDSQGNKITQEHTDWIPIQIFGRSAEIAEQYFKKGDKFACTGKIRTSTYKDEQGNTRGSWCVEVKSFDFLKPKAENADNAANAGVVNQAQAQNLQAQPPQPEPANVVTDEIIENAEETAAVESEDLPFG